MPFKDDIRQLTDLKQQILQKMILLVQHIAMTCELAAVVLKRRCKLRRFFLQ